jgi:hypothetical protein
VVLRSEVNDRWPIRDKTSDGTLGNASHAAGSSDHNPDARGVVCAIDFDEDLTLPAGAYPSFRPGERARELADELVANAKAGLTPQLYYVIYEGKIYSRTYGFRARDYSGANPHDHHVHVSVFHPAKYADSTESWEIDMPSLEEIRAVVREEINRQSHLDKQADAVLKRDDVIPNTFTDNSENTHVAIATALGVLGERTKP